MAQIFISGKVVAKMDPAPIPVWDTRPRFGKKQITKQDKNIAPGRKIVIHGPGEITIEATVISVYKENGDLKLDYEFYKDREDQVGTVLLAEVSVIKDRNGNWNTEKWLEKA
jgi:hypothetical protein